MANSAGRPGQSDALVIKWRASAAADEPLLFGHDARVGPAPEQGAGASAAGTWRAGPYPPPDPLATGPVRADPATGRRDRARSPHRARTGAKAAPMPAASETVAAPQAPFPDLADVPEVPEDIETRPDGSPGSLTAYAPKQLADVFIPRVAPIMAALATRPGPYRLVNDPASQIETATGLPRSASDENPRPDAATPPVETPAPDILAANHDLGVARGPLDVTERVFSGDSLSRFASARFDPDAPVPTLLIEDEDSVVELELISTGGDPEAEAHRAAMIAAHPEGKPIVVFRHGAGPPAVDGADPRAMDRIGKAPPDT